MQRWLFQREIEELAATPVFYLDKCGVDHRLYREYARALRGRRVYQEVSGSQRHRTSIISASRSQKLVAPFVFDGHCDSDLVDLYFKTFLLPALPPGSVIVLDNARFYQSPTTLRLVQEAGCHLLFLPAYSPDINPIEHVRAAFKSRLRKDLPNADDPFLFVSDMCQCYC